MTDPSPPLPRFRDPPIVEVALSVQFEPSIDLRVAHFGLLWERFRSDFPKTQQHAPIERAVEEFGARRPFGMSVGLEVIETVPMPRCWFLNEPETELIQIQQDRLVVNWKKGSGEEQYPHFDRVRDLFVRAYNTYSEFVHEEHMGALVPDQCEVTYVDHITGSGVWERHGELDKILTIWSSLNSAHLPLEPENVRLALQYAIPGEGDTPLGRLHIQIQPAYRRSDDTPIVVMNTTARGRPLGDGVEGVLRFFDVGHSWSVHAFAALISPEMQQAWGTRDGNH